VSIGWRFRRIAGFVFVAFVALMLLTPALVSPERVAANQEQPADPWSNGEILHAGDLAQTLTTGKAAERPTIVYVGFRTLYEGGHIPGAVFHGTASTEKGLAELKKALADLPHATNVVIYCGCCPFDRCPNIRPAYKAVHEMGFGHVRVLVLPTSFAADWVEKGYAIEKGLP
jgi:thiosulfate/3-mercaptopyruvate sulfurtransferase